MTIEEIETRVLVLEADNAELKTELLRIKAEHVSLLGRVAWAQDVELLKQWLDSRVAAPPEAVAVQPATIEQSHSTELQPVAAVPANESRDNDALRAEQEICECLAQTVDLLLHAIASGNLNMERAAALKRRVEALQTSRRAVVGS